MSGLNNMKDLIIIGTYCPDKERENMLNDCVESLQYLRKDFDILISSHTIIPEYIASKVDYTFFDANNQIITDWKYLNQPWFSPYDGFTIQSAFVTESSTYVAVYRVLISSFGIAKALNYKTVHWIEYDSILNDYSELYDNSVKIKNYTAITYKKEFRNYESNLEWGYGCFQTINIEKVTEKMLVFDEDFYLELLDKSSNKTNEKITQDLYLSKGGEILFKNFDILSDNGNRFNLSSKSKKDEMDYWTLPFYDTKSETVKFITWNNKDTREINVMVIINDERVIKFEKVGQFAWQIKEIGNINDISSITILIDGKLKRRFELDDENRKIFTKVSHSVYS